MLRTGSVVALAALSIALSACGGRAPRDAAESASRLMAAALANDRVAFEAEIDRTAVREDLRRQVTELAQPSALDVEGGPSDLALDRMIGPDALTLVHAGSGKALTAPPTAGQVEPLLKVVGRKRVCLSDPAHHSRCLLTFAKAQNHWRLVGMQAMDLRIEVRDAGA